jgi:hypothetical protein
MRHNLIGEAAREPREAYGGRLVRLPRCEVDEIGSGGLLHHRDEACEELLEI